MKVFVIGGLAQGTEDGGERTRLATACNAVGSSIAAAGHSLVLCSPFGDSADSAVLTGVALHRPSLAPMVEFHFVDTKETRAELNRLTETLGLHVTKCPHPAPAKDSDAIGMRYAWLFCQLWALDSCQVVIALGGKEAGSANMLLLLAEERRKPVLPFSSLGGAAAQSLSRRRYELEDRLGSQWARLNADDAFDSAGSLVEILATSATSHAEQEVAQPPRFFISYSRARSAEADFVEMLLRRRNQVVFRDESEFGAGHAVPTEIREAIYGADVFVAIWCREYACSPWCYDELNLALDRSERGDLDLWILCVDDTRIIPPRARSLVNFPVCSRQELEGRVMELLRRRQSSAVQKNPCGRRL
jgi:hypothetical protein